MKARSSLLLVATRFVLVEPRHNPNVGLAARALKTMGFRDLVLVRPNDPKVLNRAKTRQMASGAVDVLDNAIVHQTVRDALADADLCCGTAMPHDMHRERRPRTYVAPRPYFARLVQRCRPHSVDCGGTDTDGSIDDGPERPRRIAFLFGNEVTGMDEQHMDACDVVLSIPTNPSFGSLNLASAVQLLAYDWREAIGGFHVSAPDRSTPYPTS